MARRYSSRSSGTGSRSTKGRGKSKSQELKSLAYKMGQIEKGLKNPKSQVSQSFDAGKRSGNKKEKRPLF